MHEADSFSPLPLERMQARLSRTSQMSFWIQAVIGAVAALSWIISPIIRISTSQGLAPTLGSTLAFWVTLLTLITLGLNLYYTWRNWIATPASGSGSRTLPPSRDSLMHQLQRVIFVSLIGAVLSVISSSAQMGELFSRAILLYSSSLRLEASGLLVAVVNTSAALAHLISLSCALWILGILDRDPVRTTKRL